MKISTRGRYSLRMMIDLAQHYNQGFTALKDISKDRIFQRNIWNRSFLPE